MAEATITWGDGHTTWYRTEGDLRSADKAPLVLLHGGPGAAHDYLESIGAHADIAGRPCVL